MYLLASRAKHLFLFSTLVAAAPAFTAKIVPHLLVHKDGEVANIGNNLDPILEVGRSGSKAWLLYQTGGADLSQTTGSALTLYLDSMHSSGTLKVFSLEAAVTAQELDVDSGDLTYNDQDPVASVALVGSDQEKVIRLDLDTLLSGGTFYGLVLEASGGLRADFSSKDGNNQPHIELQYDFATPAQVTQVTIDAQAAVEAFQDAAEAASAAAGFAAAAAASATAAGNSEIAAAVSADSAAASASAAAAAIPPGTALFTLNPTPPSGFTSTGVRINSEKPWVSKAAQTYSRYGSGATVYNGKLYVAGGGTAADATYIDLDSYDPSTNTWTIRASMPAALNQLTLSEVGGKLYAIGGRDGSSVKTANYRYDPSTNTWATRASMPTARFAHGAIVHNGKIHILGGAINISNTMTTSHQIYDPVANTWSTGTALPAGKACFSAENVDGKFYLIGGADGTTTTVATTNIFNPTTNTWSSGTSLHNGKGYMSSISANGLIYLFGGWRATSGYVSEAEQYDPVSNTFTPILAIPYPKGYSSAGLIGGNAYVVGGLDGSLAYSAMEAYTIPTTLFGILKN